MEAPAGLDPAGAFSSYLVAVDAELTLSGFRVTDTKRKSC
jgi:hypothetical protein